MRKLIVVLGALVASVLPAFPAHSAPSISILNPSSYGPAEVSIKHDSGDDYHFVGWVGDIPASPSVQFVLADRVYDATPAASDTWEARYGGEVADGTYTLTARLLSGGVEVARAQRSVEVRNSTLPLFTNEAAEMGHPANGGPLGFYSPPGRAPRAVIDVTTSAGATSVRALFSTSAPGSEPEWTQCGSSAVPASLQVRMRCTLRAGVAPLRVTAVAVTTNSTPFGSPSASFDDSGDAHRVVPYVQDPAIVSVTPDSTSVEVAQCGTFFARVLDQQARPVPGANIDVHAAGPDATLRFGSGMGIGAFQAPESGHGSESAVSCADGSDAGAQGAHEALKHIESTTGTDNSGEWVFALRSPGGGGTQVSLWVDENDDDGQALAEPAAGAQVGWGQDPPPPQRELLIEPVSGTAIRTACTRIGVATRQGGSPAPFQNVDVHISGPSAGISFCDPGGAGPSQPPDSGGHGTGGVHADASKHLEGSSGLSAVFVFGIRSDTRGMTNVTAWIDETDDDVATAEPVTTATMKWNPLPFRSISFQASRARIDRGGSIRLYGRLGGDDVCISRKRVKIQSKPMSGGSFRTIQKIRTDGAGKFEARFDPKRSRKYRAVAPATKRCFKATSRRVAVRVRR